MRRKTERSQKRVPNNLGLVTIRTKIRVFGAFGGERVPYCRPGIQTADKRRNQKSEVDEQARTGSFAVRNPLTVSGSSQLRLSESWKARSNSRELSLLAKQTWSAKRIRQTTFCGASLAGGFPTWQCVEMSSGDVRFLAFDVLLCKLQHSNRLRQIREPKRRS